MSNIAALKQAVGAGGRVNKYKLKFNMPSAVSPISNISEADVLCKSTQFPGVTITPIEVYNQGRKLLIPGDTTYENTWTVIFYNTEDHALRRDMINWMKAADNFQENKHSGNPADVLTEIGVSQLDSMAKETATYTFHNVFVSGVDAVELSDDPDGNIQEFSVTFTFSDWVVGTEATNQPDSGKPATKNSTAL